MSFISEGTVPAGNKGYSGIRVKCSYRSSNHPGEAQPIQEAEQEVHMGTLSLEVEQHLYFYIWKSWIYLCLIKNKEENGMLIISS